MTGPRMNHVEARSNKRPARQYVSETHDHKPDAPSRAEPRSAATHTPGPWSKVGCVVYSEVDRFYHHPVARVGAPLDKDDNRVEEAEANARLIAAAPELLEALKDALRSLRKDFKAGPDGDRQHREAYAEQFSAVAKAIGGGND